MIIIIRPSLSSLLPYASKVPAATHFAYRTAGVERHDLETELASLRRGDQGTEVSQRDRETLALLAG